MKLYGLLSAILLALLFLTAGCGASSWTGLPVISQFAVSTATPTATPTPTPTRTPLPTPTRTPLPTPTSLPAATPKTVPTATILPAPSDTPSPTPTLALAPEPVITATEIARGNPERPWIALTFNTGAILDPWPSILETLRQKDVRCTFFLTGDTLRRPEAPNLLRQAVAEGHELGNHSNTHRDFTQLTDEEIARELAALEEMVVDITGISTKPYFRPPSGARDHRVWQVVQENGYINIYWTYGVRDWTADRTAEKIYASAVGGACNGAILVMHVGAWETADMLPAIIDELRARGYRLVTLGELLSP